MDSTVTTWAFGFGGWVGVLASTFMLINIPHNYTFSLVLLSPWVGGISMYLFMYLTHCWINISSQIAVAMVKYEIIMALMTSIIGVMVVAVARLIIDMERGHKTPAEQAATESVEATVDAESVPNEASTPDADDEATDDEATDDEATDDEATDDEATDDEATDTEAADDEEESGGDSATSETDSSKREDDETEEESTELTVNQARIEETSFENINTPQLQGIPNTSPIPKLPDM
jgi:hypothetical protein